MIRSYLACKDILGVMTPNGQVDVKAGGIYELDHVVAEPYFREAMLRPFISFSINSRKEFEKFPEIVNQLRRVGDWWEAPYSPDLFRLSQLGVIEIARGIDPKDMFYGPPEPILDGDSLRYLDPDRDGVGLAPQDFGVWRCMRCEHDNIMPPPYTQPFECEGETCGRKGAFRRMFPHELIDPIWEPPGRPQECSGWELYEDILSYLKVHLVLADHEYHVMSLWILASWITEDFKAVPYLLFIAPKESGKTQALSTLRELAYRAVLAVSVTPAALFRAIELWRITLLIDEAERTINPHTDMGSALYGALNGGYKRGMRALRAAEKDGEWIPARYGLFGFKALASTKSLDPTLESRCITINMLRGRPKNIMIDQVWGMEIRSKALYWRYRNMHTLAPRMAKSVSGRIIELLTPLYTVAQVLKVEGVKPSISYPEVIQVLDMLVASMESSRKEEEEESEQAYLLEAISDLQDEGQEKAAIPLKDIAEKVGWVDKEGKPQSRKVGAILKSLGMPPKHGKQGSYFNLVKHAKRLAQLSTRYLRGKDKVLARGDGDDRGDDGKILSSP